MNLRNHVTVELVFNVHYVKTNIFLKKYYRDDKTWCQVESVSAGRNKRVCRWLSREQCYVYENQSFRINNNSYYLRARIARRGKPSERTSVVCVCVCLFFKISFVKQSGSESAPRHTRRVSRLRSAWRAYYHWKTVTYRVGGVSEKKKKRNEKKKHVCLPHLRKRALAAARSTFSGGW